MSEEEKAAAALAGKWSSSFFHKDYKSVNMTCDPHAPKPVTWDDEGHLRKRGGRFDMVSIQNATLAGGVAVGSAANLLIAPWGALLIGGAA